MVNYVTRRRVPSHKYLQLILVSKLGFGRRLSSMLCKVNKKISYFRICQNILSQHSPLTKYKTLV